MAHPEKAPKGWLPPARLLAVFEANKAKLAGCEKRRAAVAVDGKEDVVEPATCDYDDGMPIPDQDWAVSASKGPDSKEEYIEGAPWLD